MLKCGIIFPKKNCFEQEENFIDNFSVMNIYRNQKVMFFMNDF